MTQGRLCGRPLCPHRFQRDHVPVSGRQLIFGIGDPISTLGGVFPPPIS